MRFIIEIARTRTDYTAIEVDAENFEDAYEKADDLLIMHGLPEDHIFSESEEELEIYAVSDPSTLSSQYYH